MTAPADAEIPFKPFAMSSGISREVLDPALLEEPDAETLKDMIVLMRCRFGTKATGMTSSHVGFKDVQLWFIDLFNKKKGSCKMKRFVSQIETIKDPDWTGVAPWFRKLLRIATGHEGGRARIWRAMHARHLDAYREDKEAARQEVKEEKKNDVGGADGAAGAAGGATSVTKLSITFADLSIGSVVASSTGDFKSSSS